MGAIYALRWTVLSESYRATEDGLRVPFLIVTDTFLYTKFHIYSDKAVDGNISCFFYVKGLAPKCSKLEHQMFVLVYCNLRLFPIEYVLSKGIGKANR